MFLHRIMSGFVIGDLLAVYENTNNTCNYQICLKIDLR